MRPLLPALVLAAGWAGTAQAHSTTCRGGTVLTDAAARAGCAAHGGRPNPFTLDALPRLEAAPRPDAPPRRTPASTSRATPAPSGGLGMVWVNTGTKAYHCQGDRYYGCPAPIQWSGQNVSAASERAAEVTQLGQGCRAASAYPAR